jgi:hypothetical protein
VIETEKSLASSFLSWRKLPLLALLVSLATPLIAVQESFWVDELQSAWAAKSPDWIARAAQGNQVPAFFGLLRLAHGIGLSADWQSRLLVGLLWACGLTLGWRSMALHLSFNQRCQNAFWWVVAIWVLIDPVAWFYAIEVRPYGMVCILSLALVLRDIRLAEAIALRHAQGLAQRQVDRLEDAMPWRSDPWWMLAAIALLATHLTSLALVVASAGARIVLPWLLSWSVAPSSVGRSFGWFRYLMARGCELATAMLALGLLYPWIGRMAARKVLWSPMDANWIDFLRHRWHAWFVVASLWLVWEAVAAGVRSIRRHRSSHPTPLAPWPLAHSTVATVALAAVLGQGIAMYLTSYLLGWNGASHLRYWIGFYPLAVAWISWCLAKRISEAIPGNGLVRWNWILAAALSLIPLLQTSQGISLRDAIWLRGEDWERAIEWIAREGDGSCERLVLAPMLVETASTEMMQQATIPYLRFAIDAVYPQPNSLSDHQRAQWEAISAKALVVSNRAQEWNLDLSWPEAVQGIWILVRSLNPEEIHLPQDDGGGFFNPADWELKESHSFGHLQVAHWRRLDSANPSP